MSHHNFSEPDMSSNCFFLDETEYLCDWVLTACFSSWFQKLKYSQLFNARPQAPSLLPFILFVAHTVPLLSDTLEAATIIVMSPYA